MILSPFLFPVRPTIILCQLSAIPVNIVALLNQTAQDWYSRVVTLSEAKGLGIRFFAALRMTFMKSLIVKCTNVLHAGLGKRGKGGREKESCVILRFSDSPVP